MGEIAASWEGEDHLLDFAQKLQESHASLVSR
jgi:hypothetical protein